MWQTLKYLHNTEKLPQNCIKEPHTSTRMQEKEIVKTPKTNFSSGPKHICRNPHKDGHKVAILMRTSCSSKEFPNISLPPITFLHASILHSAQILQNCKGCCLAFLDKKSPLRNPTLERNRSYQEGTKDSIDKKMEMKKNPAMDSLLGSLERGPGGALP